MSREMQTPEMIKFLVKYADTFEEKLFNIKIQNYEKAEELRNLERNIGMDILNNYNNTNLSYSKIDFGEFIELMLQEFDIDVVNNIPDLKEVMQILIREKNIEEILKDTKI